MIFPTLVGIVDKWTDWTDADVEVDGRSCY